MGEQIGKRWSCRFLYITQVMLLATVSPMVTLAQDQDSVETVDETGATEADADPSATPDAGSDVDLSTEATDGEVPTVAIDDKLVTPASVPTFAVDHVINTDSLVEISPTDGTALSPGQQHEYAFSYFVTTSRAATVIDIGLRLADGSPAVGWQVRASVQQGDWQGDGPFAQVSEPGSIVPDTIFTLAVRVVAPPNIGAERTAFLHLSSTVVLETGELEPGVDAAAALDVFPAAPTEDSSIPSDTGPDPQVTEVEGEVAAMDESGGALLLATPTASHHFERATPEPETTEGVIGALQSITADEVGPSQESGPVACDSLQGTEVVPSAFVDIGCLYTAVGDQGTPRVTVSFTDVAGEGWQVAVGQVNDGVTHWGPVGESAAWKSNEPISVGATIHLVIRVFAPGSADTSYRATVAVAVDDRGDPAFTWTVGVVDGQSVALASTGCVPTVSITSAHLSWDVPYSDAERRLDGEITYRVSTAETCGWSVSMSATWFDYSGPHGSTGISPSRIAFESSRLTAHRGVREVTVRGTLGRAVTLLSADSSTAAATVEHTLALRVTLPDDTAPGRYSSTVTITVTGSRDPGG